jgi:signal transduction histidine kinase
MALIGTRCAADKRDVTNGRSEAYRSWLAGELVLVALLGLATALLAATGRLEGYALPDARVALDTAVAVCATIVAILAAVRFRVEGRAMDLMLAVGFIATGVGTFAFGVLPLLPGGGVLGEPEVRATIAAALISAVVFAIAPFLRRRLSHRDVWLAVGGVLAAGALVAISAWSATDPVVVPTIADDDGSRSTWLIAAYALLALLTLVAVIGFGLRFRRHGRDLDSWLALAFTLVVFANLHYVLSPTLSGGVVLHGDFLRLMAYGVLLVGVWRAISEAEFGRAVAEERARVARDIHDGLAQYLFAISTHVSMLEGGAPLEQLLPRLKLASRAAQQEARFAVLALSSAGGTAPFDAALRRYVDFLAADGELDVELEIDPIVALAPDEQIEVFRIVQEGLANVRRHAGARHAEVAIEQRGARRVVRVHDDGIGFDLGDDAAAGQGLKNMRARAASIDGGFTMRSSPGEGTAIEIVLRAA